MEREQYNNGYFSRPVGPLPSAATSADITPFQPGTPNTDGSRNPFGDSMETASAHRQSSGNNLDPNLNSNNVQSTHSNVNPFASPDPSRPASSYGSSSGLGVRNEGHRFFHSRRIQKGEIEKPWIGKSAPKEKWVSILPMIGILIGLGISGFLVYDGVSSVVHHKYCSIMDEDFSGGLDTNIWTKEVELGGFGYAALILLMNM